MAEKLKTYECYPWWSVLIDNLLTISLHIIALYFLFLIWPWLMMLYISYVVYLEWSLYHEGCIHCYYYGKVCHSGRGLIAKLLCKRGDPNVFLTRTVTFKEFIPQFLPNLIVLLVGIFILVFKGFSWLILLLMFWPVVIFFLNQITFGVLACPHCKQGQIGCPVYKMFAPKEENK